MGIDSETINITSVVSARNNMPFVQMKWGDMGCQMTPDEAREHAYGILDAANAAETDSIMLRFLADKIGVETQDAADVLREFRTFREQKTVRPKPEAMIFEKGRRPILDDGSHRHKR